MKFSSVYAALTLSLLLAASCASPTSSGTNADAPFVGTSKYLVFFSFDLYSASEGINVSVMDPDNNYKNVSGAVIKVDGVSIPINTNNYYLSATPAWTAGSSHTYSIKTPDGQTASGDVVVPSGTLSGLTYAPAKPTITSSYTISPPGATWPANAFVAATVNVSGSYYGYEKRPTGTGTVVFNGGHFDDTPLTDVSFKSAIQTVTTLAGYASGSQVKTTGMATSW